jgi:hypothetical protein
MRTTLAALACFSLLACADWPSSLKVKLVHPVGGS